MSRREPPSKTNVKLSVCRDVTPRTGWRAVEPVREVTIRQDTLLRSVTSAQRGVILSTGEPRTLLTAGYSVHRAEHHTLAWSLASLVPRVTSKLKMPPVTATSVPSRLQPFTAPPLHSRTVLVWTNIQSRLNVTGRTD